MKTSIKYAFVSTLSFAPLCASALEFSGPHEVKSVIVGGYGVHVEVSPAPVQCTGGSWEGTQAVLLRANVDYKTIYTALLAAHATGRKIMLWHDAQGNGTCGWENQRTVQAVQIK